MATIAQLVGANIKSPAVIEHVHSRQTFAAQRNTALTRQRDGVQGRLDSLRNEVRKIQDNASKLDDPTQIREAIAKLERMGRAEAKLVDDIARLNIKIGA